MKEPDQDFPGFPMNHPVAAAGRRFGRAWEYLEWSRHRLIHATLAGLSDETVALAACQYRQAKRELEDAAAALDAALE